MPANYVLLQEVTLNATGAASVTFSSIPQSGYTDLVLKMSARTARTNDGNGDDVKLYFNGDFGSNYSNRTILGTGAAANSENISSSNLGVYGITASNSSAANTFGSGEYYIPNYTSSAQKTVSSETVSETFINTAYARIVAGSWTGTAAITSITLQPGTGPTFIENSTFYLYGVAKLGVSPVIAPKATGGNIVVNDGTYWYHAFLSTGTFTPTQALSCDVLQIAGGGGGGSRSGGGGGAGGISYLTSQSVIASAQTVIVGAGGTGGSRSINGSAGSNSQFASLTAAVGGGVGASALGNIYSTSGGPGGSGGGGANNGNGGSATSGQGFAGGNSNNNSFDAAGGGGAGAVGANASTGSLGSGAGAGGAGVNTYSTWATTTGTGVSGFYAGGGGGGSYGSSNHGAGGSGGGGAGADTAPTNGTANTGGGAGGAGNSANTNGSPLGANGGSGIVIVRYTVA